MPPSMKEVLESVRARELYRGDPSLIGKIIGKITITEFHRKSNPQRNSVYKGLCECGVAVYRREHWVKNPRNDGYDRCVDCQNRREI